MKKCRLLELLLSGMLLITSGCVRLSNKNMSISITGGRAGTRIYARPSERFYYGTRGNISHCCERPGIFLGFFLVDLPFEIVTDTVLLPVDCYHYLYYYTHLPQAVLVEQGKNSELEKRLQEGEPPSDDAVRRAMSCHCEFCKIVSQPSHNSTIKLKKSAS